MSNRFARGFSTLEQEITCDRLPVKGTVPGWLTGTLLRNGPGKFEMGEQTYHRVSICLWSEPAESPS